MRSLALAVALFAALAGAAGKSKAKGKAAEAPPQGGSAAVMKARAGDFEVCYQQAMTRLKMGESPKKVKATVQLEVGPNGVVLAAKVLSTDYKDRGFSECLVGRALNVPFPETGASSKVTWPLSFAPEPEATD